VDVRSNPRHSAVAQNRRARRFVRRMRGGSQSSLVQCDVDFWVVKWQQNPQHRRVLINEAICSELLRRLHIASPEWGCVLADRRFLRSNPELCISLHRGIGKIEPGLHFGSRFPVDPDVGAVYDQLPAAAVLNNVSNPWDLIKAFAFDVWVDNRDTGQAIFFGSADRLRAEIVDHGHAFGFDGVDWRFSTAPTHRPYPVSSEFYTGADAMKYYRRAMSDIRLLAKDTGNVLALVPDEWIQDDGPFLERHLRGLAERAQRLDVLLDQTLAYLVSSLPAPGDIRAMPGGR
jgi:HipA-like protein